MSDDFNTLSHTLSLTHTHTHTLSVEGCDLSSSQGISNNSQSGVTLGLLLLPSVWRIHLHLSAPMFLSDADVCVSNTQTADITSWKTTKSGVFFT